MKNEYVIFYHHLQNAYNYGFGMVLIKECIDEVFELVAYRGGVKIIDETFDSLVECKGHILEMSGGNALEWTKIKKVTNE